MGQDYPELRPLAKSQIRLSVSHHLHLHHNFVKGIGFSLE